MRSAAAKKKEAWPGLQHKTAKMPAAGATYIEGLLSIRKYNSLSVF
jgi:hypothetical protein